MGNAPILCGISRSIGDDPAIDHSVPKSEVAVVVPTPSGAKRNVFVHPFGAASNDLGSRRLHRKIRTEGTNHGQCTNSSESRGKLRRLTIYTNTIKKSYSTSVSRT